MPSVKNLFCDVRKRTLNFLKNLALKERSPNKLAISFAVGIYIAICPFVGLHTLMIFIFAWVFRLNTAVTFATGYVTNNPFTIIPIFASDYAFGYWLLHNVLHFKTQDINPSWINFISDYLYLKLKIPHACFWSFMIGGNILAIAAALISYPIVKPIFVRIVKQVYKKNGAQK